jgi:hypothetical protein
MRPSPRRVFLSLSQLLSKKKRSELIVEKPISENKNISMESNSEDDRQESL